MSLKNFEVVARPLPTATVPNPSAIRVQVFAPDEVVAKSRFWTVARRIARLKRTHGEILAVQQVLEPEPTRVKNYGVWLTFRSTRATHNIYKEYRDTTTEAAVLQLYSEMAGTHNVSSAAISIIRIAEIANDDVVHPTIKQFTADGLKFPITKQLIRPAHPSQKKIFSKKRPTVCGF
jgi:large subunit ribosomal protein L18Ae